MRGNGIRAKIDGFIFFYMYIYPFIYIVKHQRPVNPFTNSTC